MGWEIFLLSAFIYVACNLRKSQVPLILLAEIWPFLWIAVNFELLLKWVMVIKGVFLLCVKF